MIYDDVVIIPDVVIHTGRPPDALANEMVQFLRKHGLARLLADGCMPIKLTIDLVLHLLHFDKDEKTRKMRNKIRKAVDDVLGPSVSAFGLVPFDKIANIIEQTCGVTLLFEHMIKVRQRLGMKLQYDDLVVPKQEPVASVASSSTSTPTTTALVPSTNVQRQKTTSERWAVVVRECMDATRDDLISTVARLTVSQEDMAREKDTLQRHLHRTVASREVVKHKLSAAETEHTQLVQLTMLRPGKRVVSVQAAYNLALLRTHGLVGARTMVAIVGGAAHQGELKCPKVVYQYEHNYCIAHRILANDIESTARLGFAAELPPGPSIAFENSSLTRLSIDTCLYCGDATKQEALEKAKVHMAVVVTTNDYL